jgi:hypothetical protein
MAKAKAKKAKKESKLVAAAELAEVILVTLGIGDNETNEYYEEDLENVTQLIGGFIKTHGIA